MITRVARSYLLSAPVLLSDEKFRWRDAPECRPTESDALGSHCIRQKKIQEIQNKYKNIGAAMSLVFVFPVYWSCCTSSFFVNSSHWFSQSHKMFSYVFSRCEQSASLTCTAEWGRWKSQLIGSDSRVFRYFLLYTYSTCVYIERESAAARAATLFTCRIFYFYLATNGGKLGDCRLVFAPVALLWLKRRDQSVFESPTRRDAVCQSAAGREKVGTRGIKSQLNMFLGTRCDCWLCFFFLLFTMASSPQYSLVQLQLA